MKRTKQISALMLVLAILISMVYPTWGATPFTDVPENSWYADPVNYCYERGLMTGVSTTAFAPGGQMTRGMLTAVLYRLSGSPAVSTQHPFSDVQPGSYYENAISWAYSNEIINGMNETEFFPNQNISREDLVTMLYRYAKLANCDLSASADLSQFFDYETIRRYAVPAFAWAVASGIICGVTPHTISPHSTANRAQCATIIYRFACFIGDATPPAKDPEPVIDPDMVAYYKVTDGVVTNLVNGEVMPNATVDGDYFRGGTVKLPSSYGKATIEVVMEYNRESAENPIGNDFSLFGGALLLREAQDPNLKGYVKVPFGGGQIDTSFILHASLNNNEPVLGAGDSYWCLAFDKNSPTYSLQINNCYTEKTHWSREINKTFTLSSEHRFKEFIVRTSRLSEAESMKNFAKTGISVLSERDTLIGQIANGITGLGSAAAFEKTGANGDPRWYNTATESGSYTVDDGNGMQLTYEINDYIEPDNNIDNSRYESVHIVKKPETLFVDYKYALSAFPYPFNVNHNGKSDQFDVSWKSSDESVALVIDGLVVPQSTGTVTITATLTGTDISDSCTIEIVEKEEIEDNPIYISESYISKNGNQFSTTDYVMTTNAIYDAITEAFEDGFNHVVFPKIEFYAAPTGSTYYIPTGMTVEFPQGSEFHMMESELGKTDGYTYFRMGWDWYDYNIPTEKAYAKLDEDGNVLGYYCKDAHLIIDKYYGEFYEEADIPMSELYDHANEYAWGCVLLNIGRRAEYCTVEIHEAQCPTGFFILMGGKVGSQALENYGESCKVNDTDFVSGWLNDEGEIEENGNWISTNRFFKVAKGVNGTDPLDEYFFGHWEENGIAATHHLYDILWFDKDYNILEIDRWQLVDEKYTKPTGAAYFKISLQMPEWETGTDSYIKLHPDPSSKFCEIRNTRVFNGADGLASVVGSTEACWIHDNYVDMDGLLANSCWCLDLEDGWLGMRGTVIERNIFRKNAYSKKHGFYSGKDSGILALSSGYNTFVISNYLGAISQQWSHCTNTHIINNVVGAMYSNFNGSVATDIRPKIWAHVYYNVIGDQPVENTSANGIVYRHGNIHDPNANKW